MDFDFAAFGFAAGAAAMIDGFEASDQLNTDMIEYDFVDPRELARR